ncbi:hypothetical protein QWM81_26145 [Streptomyces ficellus]|uniref:LLM class flavin-dependent oxidoreductase n=1 Tax=Streptomyces ficellus TaxID=1977088 RepID=A0ABT7ZD71_9ACTN|nr:hypothetical protein [Streptomyces ficellus]MDN3297456.1 hypothetical protein [Streptomyces ficellus]
MAIEAPERDPYTEALASAAMHMQIDHYAAMLARGGITYDINDPKSAGAAMVDGGAFLYGTLDELAGLLAEYREAGVDEVVLHTTGVLVRFGEQAVKEELGMLLSACVRACVPARVCCESDRVRW